MKIELYVLVDSSGRIIYTSSDVKDLEVKQIYDPDIKIVKLEGEYQNV